ncbi:ATP-binding protein [Candidatus Kryptonium thompsonii]|uniref:ATP-binding protein n=1 Tax=Candidatus Kryptonium thompsonii TaxID=1633631 RepID=UPI0007084CCF|nr:ATP-binding protein [Candidatus Kryptonium thompsoni]CUS79252.1 hypothetical protein JGI15_100527 [Candidatus Kryptonium thompsoni]
MENSELDIWSRYERLKRSFNVLTQITANMVSTLELDELLQTLLDRLTEVTNADAGIIAVFENGELVIKSVAGIFPKDFVNIELTFEEGSFSWRVINEGNLIYQESAHLHSKILDTAYKLGISASLGVPLKRFNKTVGVISIHWVKPHPPDDEEVRLLEITAERAAMAIINANLFKQVKIQAELIELSPDAVIVRDLNDVIKFWNKSAEEIYGWKKEEAIGKKITGLIYDQNELETYFKAKDFTLKEGKWQGELKQVTKDGKKLTVLSRFKVLYDNSGNPYQIISVDSDITEMKKIETLLNRTQRLESIGRLASGIAHDLNNILQPIAILTHVFKRKLQDESDLKYIEIIQSSIQRATNIINQILSFSKGIAGEKGIVQVKHLIRELEVILKETFPKNIKIEIEVQKDLWPIVAEPNQMMQVLLNLCVNARDAMPNGGTLKIKAQNSILDKHYITQLPNLKPGPYVIISVEDTGTGIPPEIIDKIFDPFFTTKELEKGTGLGLAQVNSIIQELNGVINVYSEPGKGTIFRIYLQAAEEEFKEKGVEKLKEEIPIGNGELILVAEDEPAVLEMIKLALEENNYRTITVNNGAEGIVKYSQNKN